MVGRPPASDWDKNGRINEQRCEVHGEAVRAYLQRDFERAAQLLQTVIDMRGKMGDVAATLLQERCEYLRENAPGDDWDGSEILKQKTW